MFGYTQMTDVVINTIQKVKVVFMQKEDSLPIKLIAPIDNTSSVYHFAKKVVVYTIYVLNATTWMNQLMI